MNILSRLYFSITSKDYFVEFDKEGAPSITYKSGEKYAVPSIRKAHELLEIDELNVMDLNTGQRVDAEARGVVKDLKEYCDKRNIEVILMGRAWEESGMYENMELDIPNNNE
jgi:hypothetical protein